jgi:cytochrome P450
MTTTDTGPVGRLTRRYDHHDPEFTPAVAEIVNGRLRDGPGVVHTEAHGGLWVLSRYATVREVLKDHQTFSSGTGVFFPRAAGTPKFSPIDYDPPEHKVLRQLMTPPLLAEAVRGLEDAVTGLAAELIDALAARGHGDVASEVAKPMAIGVLARAIGLSEAAQHRIRELTANLWRHLSTEPDSSKFWPAFDELLSAELALARSGTRPTYLSHLATSKVDGKPLPDETLHSIIVSYAIAGHETTMNTISRMLWYLGQRPDLQRRLRDEPHLRAVAADETLRRWCPTDRFTRVATRDVTLDGVAIPRGGRVLLLIDAANRDPAKFDDPDSFSLDRTNAHQHLSFGFGIHACMGAHLARLELRTVLAQLARHPGYRLAAESRPHFENGRHIVFDRVELAFGSAQ